MRANSIVADLDFERRHMGYDYRYYIAIFASLVTLVLGVYLFVTDKTLYRWNKLGLAILMGAIMVTYIIDGVLVKQNETWIVIILLGVTFFGLLTSSAREKQLIGCSEREKLELVSSLAKRINGTDDQ